MNVCRTCCLNTDQFLLGDEIWFKLTTGERVCAKAVQECEDGMIFITKDCIEKEVPVYKIAPKVYSDYIHSDLRLIKRAEMARKKEDVIPLSESEKAMEFYKRPAYAGTMLCMDSAWRPGAPEYERRRRKEV